jgi:basic membrane protein A
MKRIKIVSVLIALLLAAIISGCIVHEEVSPDEKTDKKVLLIFSYHPEHPWVIEETRGVEDIFKDKGVETEKFYLDTKRNTSAEWKKKVSEDAVKKIAEFKPDLVIVFDDNACELVAMKYAGKALPFVFCGMNCDPEDYGFPAENIAGVVERQYINGTLDLLKQLVPDVKKAAIITDNSPTSHGFVTRIEKTALPVEISECYTTDDFDAWKAKVKELQPEVDAIGLFTYHTIKDPAKAGEISLPPEDVLNWTLRNSKLPEFAFLDFTVKGGALCGVTLSGYEQGKAAAEIAIEILEGKKPADIPIKCPEKGNPMVNERRAEELDITVPTDIVKEVELIDSGDWEKGEPKELKVAVLHIGPIDDYGWTYKAHLGAQAMAEELPFVELSEKEEACGPDAPQIMREYAGAGYKVIFCHAWDFGEYIEEVAPNCPDVIFMWGNGVEKKAPNVGIYYGRMYEAKFLVGMVAGTMTKTNKIGYAAGIPISDVVRGINAFARGVASVNPDANVYVEWVGEWYNPPKEREVALALIDNGCDVITHHTDSYAPAVVADERGVYYISLNSNLRMFAPHVFLTGAVWNWAPVMTDVVKAVHEGTWDEYPGQDWWYGLAEGGVKLAPFSDLVPDDVRELVEEKKQAIIEGEFEVFPGMTDEELREIYYFEPNVVGELPVREAEEAIKIGAIYPLTGSLATTGTDVRQ